MTVRAAMSTLAAVLLGRKAAAAAVWASSTIPQTFCFAACNAEMVACLWLGRGSAPTASCSARTLRPSHDPGVSAGSMKKLRQMSDE